MEDHVFRITNLVRELIINFLPKDAPQNAIQNYHSYFLRIISSKINSQPNLDENSVLISIQKKLQKRAEVQSLSDFKLNEMSLRLHELLQNLNNRKTLKNKIAMCYLLSRINNGHDSSPINILPNMDSFAKSESKVNSNKNFRKGGMEIENTLVNPTEGRSGFLSKIESSNQTKLFNKRGEKGNASLNITENDLLRDIIFAFQGINGNYVYFSGHDDHFMVKPTLNLTEPVTKMLLQLCEMGWLYKKVLNFINEANLEPRGLVHQSLCYALKEELNEYYRLIALLENLRDNDDERSHTPFLNEEQSANKSLTLRKLYLWSLESFDRLKWLSIFCDSCKVAKGSAIISIIYGYTKQGSPFVQTLVNRVFKRVLDPFSGFLKYWVYHGELHDQFDEFFIKIDPNVKDDNLWSYKYLINKEMVPGFLDLHLAEKILTIGKSVNFLRRCCGFNDWVLDINFIDINSTLISNVNHMLNFTELREWILNAKEITSKVLLKVLFDKFKLLQHFETIKKFLLLGQGDFIQYLMDLLIKELSHPATSIYKHNLLSLLETAIRSSNAQYVKNEFLSRIDVKLLDPSPGDKGWDVFSLTYQVESPLTTILHPKVVTGYFRLFNFLWRIKRIEYSLNSIWVQHMKEVNSMNKSKELRPYIHKCNILRNEMVHFTGNLLNYLMIEVIESAWKTFIDDVKNANDLDEVIRCHEKFVDSMLEKALLTQRNDKIYKQVLKLFDFIFRFQLTQETLVTSIQEENRQKAELKTKQEMMEIIAEDLSESASYDIERKGNTSFEVESAEKIATRNAVRVEALNNLRKVWKDYKTSFVEFMGLLRDETHAVKLRFLSFRLDFNEYYSSISPESLEMRDRSLDSFRIQKNQKEYLDYDLNPSRLYNKPEPSISPPKFDRGEKMLTENIGYDQMARAGQGDSYAGFNRGIIRDPPSASSIYRSNDFDLSSKYSRTENLSNIHESIERLGNLLKGREMPRIQPEQYEEREFETIKSEEGGRNVVAPTLSYRNKFEDNKSLLKSFNYAGLPNNLNK